MALTSTVPKRARSRRPKPQRFPARLLALLLLSAVGIGVATVVLQAQYTFTLQSPFRIRFQWPLVIAARSSPQEAGAAQADQSGRRLTAYQQYACNKFGLAWPHRIGCSTRRKPARGLRDLSLQLRWHARLGLLPDQHGAPETRRSQSSGPPELQSQYRLCVQTLHGAGL
jgi:hypothetical protein